MRTKLKHRNYVVYSHKNKNGATFIGSGNNLSPDNFRARSLGWKFAFKNFSIYDYKIAIIAVYKTRREALEHEWRLINELGIYNLVNN